MNGAGIMIFLVNLDWAIRYLDWNAVLPNVFKLTLDFLWIIWSTAM